MKEAAVQRRHNLYRDSIVLNNSDPNLHLLGETPSIDWAGEFGGAQEEGEDGDGPDGESQKKRRMKQVVSMIQVDDPAEKSLQSPGVADLPEESGGNGEETLDSPASPQLNGALDGSVSKVEGAKAEEQGEEETESRPIGVPPSPAEEPAPSQEVLEEELPPPPPEEVLSAALGVSAPGESPDFPPPPHDDDDSGFQSPTAETEEGLPGQSAAAAEAATAS